MFQFVAVADKALVLLFWGFGAAYLGPDIDKQPNLSRASARRSRTRSCDLRMVEVFHVVFAKTICQAHGFR